MESEWSIPNPFHDFIEGTITMILKQTWLSFIFFYFLYGRNPHWIEEICDTPAEKLASLDPTGACVEEAWQTVGGMGADF
jgi:hypothetical protein